MDRGVLGAARVWWGGGVLKSVSGKKDSRMQENSVMLLGSSKAPVSPLHVATSCACPIRSPSTSTSKPETHEITQGSPGRGDGGGGGVEKQARGSQWHFDDGASFPH